MRKLSPVFLLGALALLSSCFAMYGVNFYDKDLPKSLSNGDIKMVIESCRTDLSNMDYYLIGTVENSGKEKKLFDSGEIEVKDVDSGISYFSISKDKETISLPGKKWTILTKQSMEAGQKIKGAVWIKTNQGDAKAKQLKVSFGKSSIILQP